MAVFCKICGSFEGCCEHTSPSPAPAEAEIVEALIDHDSLRFKVSKFLDALPRHSGLHSDKITDLINLVAPIILERIRPLIEEKARESERAKWAAYLLKQANYNRTQERYEIAMELEAQGNFIRSRAPATGGET